MASANGHTDIVKLLLAHGANPNALNKSKNTPLRISLFMIYFYRLGCSEWQM